MSEEKFSVPVKKPIEKKSATKKSSTDKVQKNPKTVSPEKKSSKPKAKPPVKKPSLDSIPDMGLLPASERHNLILGKSSNQKKSEKKEEKKSERSVNLETIKKVQTKQKANEKIPEVGARKAVKKSPIGLLIIIIILLLCLIIFAYAISSSKKKESDKEIIHSSMQLEDELILNIEKGMSAFQVASQLSPLFDKDEFLNELQSRGLEGALQVGKYKIRSGNTLDEIIKAITTKQSYIKVYDGQDINTIDLMLANKRLIKRGEFVKACEKVKENRQLPFAEGWFLSGTYLEAEDDISFSLATEMNNALLDYIKAHSEEFNNSEYSINELLIIASMVQRETQNEEQMPLIASVIFNRLENDMPLGIDATTRYEIDDWESEISQKTYDKITPYNTRRKKGLPPTGIGCVSEKALNAVLNPAVTDYLYYRHGKDGKLYLALTYDEHLKNGTVAK